MIITYHGETSFKVQVGKLSLITDPQPRFKADITLLSSVAEPGSVWPPEQKHIYGAGEYEIEGVEIKGIQSGKDTIYIARIDGIKLCFLGNVSEVENESLEKLGEIDILFAPSSTSAKTIKQLNLKLSSLLTKSLIF